MVPDSIFIPDRIYIPVNPFNDGGTEDFCVNHKTFDTDIEYIRKDALLEWVKEQKTLMGLGGHVSIDDVINKIKSL